jgi:hypothetical protein
VLANEREKATQKLTKDEQVRLREQKKQQEKEATEAAKRERERLEEERWRPKPFNL